MADRGLADFWKLHARASKGILSPVERSEYRLLLESFLRATTDAQNVGLLGKHEPRASPRVRRAVQAELALAEGPVRTLTFDVGLGGFSALSPAPLRPGTTLEFRLRLARGVEVVGAARVVARRLRGGDARISFAYEELRGGASALEAFVVEALQADLLPGSRFLNDVSSRLTDGGLAAREPPPAEAQAGGPPALLRLVALP